MVLSPRLSTGDKFSGSGSVLALFRPPMDFYPLKCASAKPPQVRHSFSGLNREHS